MALLGGIIFILLAAAGIGAWLRSPAQVRRDAAEAAADQAAIARGEG